jgi:hypothetical protein
VRHHPLFVNNTITKTYTKEHYQIDHAVGADSMLWRIIAGQIKKWCECKRNISNMVKKDLEIPRNNG